MGRYKHADYLDDFSSEPIKYKRVGKKKKSVKKVDHRHNYEKVILHDISGRYYSYYNSYYLGELCTICGKSKIVNLFPRTGSNSVFFSGSKESELEALMECYPEYKRVVEWIG